MVTTAFAAWAFTLVFLPAAGWSLLRVRSDRARPLAAVGHALHALMALDMAAMTRPWWPGLPAAPQVALFLAAAVWFAVMAVLQAVRAIGPDALGGHGRAHQVAHTVMMLAMVWMVAVMSAHSSSPSGHHHGMSPGIALLGTGATAGLVIAGTIFLVQLLDLPRAPGGPGCHPHPGDIVLGAVMNLGMAAMCWPMLTG